MISAEKENVGFDYDEIGEKKINPADSNGQVEQWVKEVEGVMRKTVALQVDKSMAAYAKEAVAEGHRETYVQKWPGKYFKAKRERCIAYMESICRLTFLFLLPFSNLFHCSLSRISFYI